MRARFAAIAFLGLVAVAATATWSAPHAGAGEGGDVASIAAGGAHTCVVLTSGEMACWGANGDGQLGAETIGECDVIPCSTEPVAVAGLPGSVQSAAAGTRHTCAVVTGGDLYCWGSDDDGQLGADAPVACGVEPFAYGCSATPLLVTGLPADVVDVGTGDSFTCALLANGEVWCWGASESGELGDGTFVASEAPVQVVGIEGATAIAVGGYHACAIVDGGAWCWGKNGEGQLGDDRACGRDCPLPTAVAGLDSGVAALTAALLHTCALSDAGAVSCWGINFDGQVGDGTDENVRTVPTPVSGLDGDIAAINGDGEFSGHTCAITTEAALVCWGDNAFGQLGDGSVIDRLVPVGVTGLAGGVEIVEAGYRHTCALAAAGLLCWGHNAAGQLGDGTTTPTTGPTTVIGFSSVAPGDANCDGALTSIDAALILQVGAALLEDLPCPGGGDANSDGAVTAVDAALVLQFVAGLLIGL